MRRTLTVLACTALLTACASTDNAAKKDGAAQPVGDAMMTIGDKAPAIDIAHWVIGDKTSLKSGNVYVVEFWATWCGPCRASMPHLSELQNHYGDAATIISVSDEPLETVTGFLAKADNEGVTWRDKISYRLTTDPDKSVKTDYFSAAGQRGIPCAFIVGKTGRVEWIGHPMRMDEPLAAVVAGSWDRSAFKPEWESAQKASREAAAARTAMREARKNQDWNALGDILDKLIDANPKSYAYKVQKFQMLLGDMNAPDKAYEYGRTILNQHWDDSSALNALAWYVADDKAVKTRDLGFAMDAANRACELTDYQEAALLDTLARVYYESGNLAEAIKWQEMAAEYAAEGSMRDGIIETLGKYRSESAG